MRQRYCLNQTSSTSMDGRVGRRTDVREKSSTWDFQLQKSIRDLVESVLGFLGEKHHTSHAVYRNNSSNCADAIVLIVDDSRSQKQQDGIKVTG